MHVFIMDLQNICQNAPDSPGVCLSFRASSWGWASLFHGDRHGDSTEWSIYIYNYKTYIYIYMYVYLEKTCAFSYQKSNIKIWVKQ